MKEPVKNIPASILGRLRNQTEVMERPFAEVLQYYAMERFLHRLSKTRYADKFILKGGLLFYAWNLSLRRPTRDIDFRGYVPSNGKELLKIVNEVIAQSAPDDGLMFDADSVSVEEPQIDADYHGIRVKLTSQLGRTKIPIQIEAETIEYPNILPELNPVRMKGYPKETVVAEKFHAMVRHAELNSRMKDYYDIWLISETFEFEGKSLQKAIETTFKKRGTEISVERPLSLSIEFASVNQTLWTNFLNKMELQNDQVADFQIVIEKIWIFLEHPIRVSINKMKSTSKWIPHKGWK